MRAKLKELGADDVGLASYVPEDPRCFSVNLRLCIGLEGSDGGDYFELFVCTPEWLGKNLNGQLWGRHFLIVREFDYEGLVSTLERQIGLCTGEQWSDIADKLARFFNWEFEDYQT